MTGPPAKAQHVTDSRANRTAGPRPRFHAQNPELNKSLGVARRVLGFGTERGVTGSVRLGGCTPPPAPSPLMHCLPAAARGILDGHGDPHGAQSSSPPCLLLGRSASCLLCVCEMEAEGAGRGPLPRGEWGRLSQDVEGSGASRRGGRHPEGSEGGGGTFGSRQGPPVDRIAWKGAVCEAVVSPRNALLATFTYCETMATVVRLLTPLSSEPACLPPRPVASCICLPPTWG